ncbi:MAG: hypothetical protein ABIS67_05265 [Candidatus Eisenbacteria bacterium]
MRRLRVCGLAGGLGVSLLIGVGSCRHEGTTLPKTNPAPAPDVRALPAGASVELELPVGGEARWDEAQLILKFRRVGGDSRCPVDVVCVWAGSATLDLSATRAGLARDFSLLAGSAGATQGTVRETADVLGFRFSFVRLLPVPRAADGPIDPASYVATVKVTKL